MGFFSRRRVVAGNERTRVEVYTVPDAWGVHMAQLSLFTNTFSPASSGAGNNRPGPGGALGVVRGDRGYGENRAKNLLPGPLQRFVGPTAPIISPGQANVGYGAGVSGQPGLPSTGDASGPAYNALAWMSFDPMGLTGLNTGG